MVAYQCIPSSSIHDICESTFHVSDNNGFIISPGYPSPYYKGWFKLEQLVSRGMDVPTFEATLSWIFFSLTLSKGSIASVTFPLPPAVCFCEWWTLVRPNSTASMTTSPFILQERWRNFVGNTRWARFTGTVQVGGA